MFCETPVLSTKYRYPNQFFVSQGSVSDAKLGSFGSKIGLNSNCLNCETRNSVRNAGITFATLTDSPKFLIMKRNSNSTVFCINTNTEYEPKTKIERNNPYTKNPQFGQAIRGSKQEQNTSS